MLRSRDERQIRSLTGVSDEVLRKLEPVFSEFYEQEKERQYEKRLAKGRHCRKAGGGRKGVLVSMYAKLCFILYYLKTYPSFDVLAERFCLSRSNAYTNVHKLLPIMSESLASLGYLPKCQCETVEDFKRMCEGLDSILIDVTQRECQRPKDNLIQKEHYSGKKGYHTMKHTLMSSSDKVILFVGQSFAGRNHDYALLKTEFPPEYKWFEDIHVKVDLGYQGIRTDYQASHLDIPHKKPRKSKKNPSPQLTAEQKAYNQLVSQARIYIENAICGMKRFRILVDAFRNRLEGFAHSVITVCAGLWNSFLL